MNSVLKRLRPRDDTFSGLNSPREKIIKMNVKEIFEYFSLFEFKRHLEDKTSSNKDN